MKPDLAAWLSWFAWLAILLAVMRVTAYLVTAQIQTPESVPVLKVPTYDIRPVK